MTKFNCIDVAIKNIIDRGDSVRVNFVPKTSHIHYQSVKSILITVVDIRELRLENIKI